MAIDKTGKYWNGNCGEDIIEYLNGYSESEVSRAVIVKCSQCEATAFTFKIDNDEGAVEVTCTSCKNKQLLLDSEEYWEDCEPTKVKCSVCKNSQHNLAIGFVYRESEEIGRSVKWIYIGSRCIKCGVLGSYGDWGINYAPTDEMERNV